MDLVTTNDDRNFNLLNFCASESQRESAPRENWEREARGKKLPVSARGADLFFSPILFFFRSRDGLSWEEGLFVARTAHDIFALFPFFFFFCTFSHVWHCSDIKVGLDKFCSQLVVFYPLPAILVTITFPLKVLLARRNSARNS